MDTEYLEPVSYGSLGSLIIHERVSDADEDRDVRNEPIGFVHFKEQEK